MASLHNGAGTAYYGRSKERADGSFVTIEFFVFLYFPLIPLRSWRVRPIGPPTESYVRDWLRRIESASQKYLTIRQPLNLRFVIAIYAVNLLKLLAILVGTLLYCTAIIVGIDDILLTTGDLTAKLRSGGFVALVIVGTSSLLYWILLGRRPRRFERVV
jgi:hypothetical protein